MSDPPTAMNDQEGSGPPEGDREPKLYRELGRRQRLARAALIAFTLYHLFAVLLGGTVAPIRRFFSPVIGVYADGFRMTNNWGMFGRPPSNANVLIEAEKKDGTRAVLSTTRASERTMFERVRDVRVRKILGKLTDEGDRGRFGQFYVDFYCRLGKIELGEELRSVRAIEIVHELKNDDGIVTRAPSKKTLVTRRCAERLGPVAPPKPGLPSFLRSPVRTPDGPPPTGEDT